MSKQNSLFSFFNKSETPAKVEKESKKTIKIKGVEVTELILLWAKVEGHPWWPGMVCKPPCGGSFVRKNSLHLQFFEKPPSRGWVKESYLKPYGDPVKVGIPMRSDSEWRHGREMANEAAKMSQEERRSLLVDHPPSDDEGNSSKENMDSSNMSNDSASAGKKRPNTSKGKAEPEKKRRRILLKSESEGESGDEYKPGKNQSATSEGSITSGGSSVSKEQTLPTEEESPVKKPKKSHKTLNGSSASTPKSYTPTAPPFTPYTPTAPPFSPKPSTTTPNCASPAVKSKLALFAAKETTTDTSSSSTSVTEQLPFLSAANIRDKKGRRPDHSKYDCRTLKVPDDFMGQQTPGHRQWWQFKSDHYDTVLFFKMGKFYELFYMDAEIGVQELGLLLMKGTTPHSGFPEISYGRYSASLIEKGYKVARIEQTETPEMMEKRCKLMKKPTKFDRVVNREVCQISSAGTRVWGVQDAEQMGADPAYLLAVAAKLVEGSTDLLEYGVAFVDTSLGVFHVGQFADDRHNSRLRTLLAHHPPVQILTERNKLPAAARSLLYRCGVPAGLMEALTPDTEYWTGSKTLKFLVEEKCYGAAGKVDWPEALKDIIDEASLTPLDGSALAVSSLGALVWYLKRCYLHTQLLTRRLVRCYVPPDCQQSGGKQEQGDGGCKKQRFSQRTMVIDGGSVFNLELVRNASTGNVEGSLLAVLDNTVTPMGRRLLQQWVSSPLLSVSAISSRLDAVEDLREHTAAVQEATALLTKLPDVDRLLPRIHSQGLKFSESDPNSRAIFYEEQQYSKKRVQCFLIIISAFKAATALPDIFSGLSLKSSLLQGVVSSTADGGRFPRLKKTIKFFEKAFDSDLAKKEGKIIPCSGVDDQYDAALDAIKDTKKELDDYLREEANYFGSKVVYFGNDKKRYQLEVSESAAKKAKGEYEFTSQRKGFKRFWTARCKELLAQMMSAEEARETALKDIARRIFQQFDDKQSLWSEAVECLTMLDVLMSLAKYSNTVDTVRPEVVQQQQGEQAFLEIRDGIHPCMAQSTMIPNDVVVGGKAADALSPLVLVTGPNMGGKSTLMRQTALLAVMAQMGSFVPCSLMKLSPVDRIFTRIGASDRMMAGESTFLLELRETAAILQHASPHALVLIDELGRGTATHDGTAVAWGVAGALVERGCRTLFSTHYHQLVHHFANTSGVSMGHMACMVEDDEATGEETITFLYKFCDGVCPKSYGFNAARLAEIPAPVVQSGRRAARLMEGRSDALLAFRKLMAENGSTEGKRKMIKELGPILEAVATT